MSAQSWSKTGFKCINSAGESAIASWFSLGVQQWGVYVHGTNTFPIAFPTACYAIAACGECDYGGNDVSIESKTNTTFKANRETSSTLNTYMSVGR